MKIPAFLCDAIVPMFTPFDSEKQLDVPGLRDLTEWLTTRSLSALFPLGGTGEWMRLTQDERKQVIQTVVTTAAGKMAVMPGVHGESLEETLELARFAEGAGSDAVTVVVPIFIEPDGEAVYRYYESVAGAVDIPVVLYEPRNMGPRSITPELFGRLSQIDNILGVKDSTSGMEKLMRHVLESRDQAAVLQGVETLYLPALSVGAVGTIGGGCNVYPEYITPIRAAFEAGDHAKALQLQRQVLDLWQAVDAGWPASGKRAVRSFGVSIGETCRVDHGTIDENVIENLGRAMDSD